MAVAKMALVMCVSLLKLVMCAMLYPILAVLSKTKTNRILLKVKNEVEALLELFDTLIFLVDGCIIWPKSTPQGLQFQVGDWSDAMQHQIGVGTPDYIFASHPVYSLFGRMKRKGSHIYKFDHIRLKVKNEEGQEVFHTMNKGAQMSELINAYCNQQMLNSATLAFLFDGHIIRPENTLKELQLEDGDEIDAMLHQIGGTSGYMFPSHPVHSVFGGMKRKGSPSRKRKQEKPPIPEKRSKKIRKNNGMYRYFHVTISDYTKNRLPISLKFCRKYLFPAPLPNPMLIDLKYKDDDPVKITSQENFDATKQKVNFIEGWPAFIIEKQLEKEDIVTFIARRRHINSLEICAHRWDKEQDSFTKL